MKKMTHFSCDQDNIDQYERLQALIRDKWRHLLVKEPHCTALMRQHRGQRVQRILENNKVLEQYFHYVKSDFRRMCNRSICGKPGTKHLKLCLTEVYSILHLRNLIISSNRKSNRCHLDQQRLAFCFHENVTSSP